MPQTVRHRDGLRRRTVKLHQSDVSSLKVIMATWGIRKRARAVRQLIHGSYGVGSEVLAQVADGPDSTADELHSVSLTFLPEQLVWLDQVVADSEIANRSSLLRKLIRLARSRIGGPGSPWNGWTDERDSELRGVRAHNKRLRQQLLNAEQKLRELGGVCDD